ncbi:MAG: single-stranded DNA-binding protein [Bacteroidales bacterium]|nr:single-stranded DNA-binding protein [Bacteroidales bacterium]
MAGVNRVILIGNLGKDPEVRHLENNVKVASFPMATSETYKNKDGQKVTTTEWHNIVVWRNLAEIAEKYLHKGSQVYLEGKLRTRTWTDKENNKRYITEIIGDSFIMLGSKKEDTSGEHPASDHVAAATETPATGDTPAEDDLPF